MEDIRPVMVPGFHLQVAARNMVEWSRQAEDVRLAPLSCSVLPKGAEDLCHMSQSKHTG